MNTMAADRRRFIKLAGTAAALTITGAIHLPARAATSSSVRIGIIGSGKVGSALGRSWI
jgi:8-hydroxy-5-deazaflavin:NADPH oxidoreductase